MSRLPFRSSAVLAAAWLFLSSSLAVRAQETPPVPPIPAEPSASVDSVSVDPQAGDTKLPIESVKPYSDWKRHAATKAEEALVQVQAGGASATGLVIRCDGFVLVPRVVRDVARNGGSVTVTLRDIDIDTDEAAKKAGVSTPTTVSALARHHPKVHNTVPFALIKTTGYHARSLPLLHSANVAVGVPVRLLWFAPAENGNRSVIVSRLGTVASPGEAKDTFTITPASAADAIPSGAIVVDGESGAAVGMVTQAGTHPAFTTFARFHVVASEVGLAPDRAAVRLGDRSGSLPTGAGVTPMVWVPGGPVVLDGAVAKDFTRDYGSFGNSREPRPPVACTPGFWMGVQPVTNGEYGRWLSTQKVRRLPFGWPGSPVVTLAGRRPDRPAVGMLAEDAGLFASAHASRLPTEVEWRRASYSRDTSWVEEMNAGWDAAGRDLDRLFAMHERHVAEAVAAAEQAARQRRGRGVSGARGLLGTSEQLQADGISLRQFLDQFVRGQWIWGHVAPVDHFRQDISIFGVRNVLINAPEYVQGGTQNTLYAPKRYPARVDPDLTQFSWLELGHAFSGSTGGPVDHTPHSSYAYFGGSFDPSPRTEMIRQMVAGYFLVRGWRGGSADWSGTISVAASDEDETHNTTTTIRAHLYTHIYSGFRCAR